MTKTTKTPNVNYHDALQKKYGVLVVFLLYVVMAVVALGANPFNGETSAPVKLLEHYAGWSSHDFSGGVVHPERSDVLDAFLPQWIVLKNQIRSGRSPLWNPVTVSGRPGIIDFTRGALTPSYLAFLLIEEHWLGFYFANLIKLVIAGLGTYLFLRFFIHPYAAFGGGVVFALSGFNAAWFYWPHVLTSAWIPWLMWATAGWCNYKTYRWLFTVTLTTIMLILGGFPAVAAYALYASSIFYFVFNICKKTKTRELIKDGLLYLLAVLSAFLLLAVPLLSLAEVLSLTNLDYRSGGTRLQFPNDLKLLYDAYADTLPRVERTLYVGTIALFLSALAVMLFIANKLVNKIRPLFIFALIVLVCSLSIAFAVLPQELIRSIPAVGGSTWSRIVVLTGFSLAVLAAIGLHCIIVLNENKRFSGLNKKAILLVTLLLMSIQFYDQYSLFKKFNTPASSHDFFSDTPAINFVKANIGNNQGIVTDKSFFFAGTLGAYSLREWFAHDFRKDTEKEVLKKLAIAPFKGPTAAMLDQGSIIYNANLYARLGIKYVLAAPEKVLYSQTHISNKPWPVSLNEPVTQYFQINKPSSVSAIGLVMATYGAKHSPVDAYLRLKNNNGLILATAYIKSTQILDNKNTIFKFNQAIHLSPGQYGFEIGLINATDATKVTAWYTEKSDNKNDILISENKTVYGSFFYSIYSKNIHDLDKNWLVHEFANEDIVVIENRLTPSGIYFIDNLDNKANMSADFLNIKSFSPDKINITNNTADDGYVVLPMRYYPGWRAYVNGKLVSVSQYMGIMPAIPVDGPSEIKFIYRPSYLKLGLTLMLSGLALLLSLLFYVKTKDDKTNETPNTNPLP
ncbi:hypothetical protein [Acinetobacter sp.]|uniref:hypothetical protein n=1 Tax=Acinetobacter sp. TaxID=472 RepID=UPI003D036113